MSKRKEAFLEEEEHKSEMAGMMRWLLTYADLITLLLGVFIVLVATASPNAEKYKNIAAQAASVFGGGGGSGVQSGSKDIKPSAGGGVMPFPIVPKAGKGDGKDSKIPDEGVTILEVPEMGTLITLSSGLLFDSGRADLKPRAKELLDTVYKDYIKPANSNFLVSGHTDNQPISNMVYPSNWELSTGRAGSVARYLLNRWQISPGRVSTAGYADTNPVTTNSTLDGRAKNRRVEIWLLRGQADRLMKKMNKVQTIQ